MLRQVRQGDLLSCYSQSLEQYVAQPRGDKALSNIELFRIQLVRDAARRQDTFYIVLHQIFCLRSWQPHSVPLILGSLSISSFALAFLNNVIMPNEQVGSDFVRWFANFPMRKICCNSHGQSSTGHTCSPAVSRRTIIFSWRNAPKGVRCHLCASLYICWGSSPQYFTPLYGNISCNCSGVLVLTPTTRFFKQLKQYSNTI
ncbi:hypothetical protein BJ546DRAFT_358659 [Cryomyces antarcticus]